MKKSKSIGCLTWVLRVIASVVVAGLVAIFIYNYSYQHVIPFTKFVDRLQLPKKAEIPKLPKEIPDLNFPSLSQSSKIQRQAPADVLKFKKKRQLVMGDLDILERATYSHIQLKNSDEPKAKREPRLNYNPSGWHNYNLPYDAEGHKAWVMNRGHLVGYQFSGLNDEPKNLITETAWVNQGGLSGMDDSNEQSMLYYENRLDDWLHNHPNDYLDYKVMPLYTGSELVARQIKLEYIGITPQGQFEAISLGGLEKIVNGKSTVILDNVAPNIEIDYQTGRAKLK